LYADLLFLLDQFFSYIWYWNTKITISIIWV